MCEYRKTLCKTCPFVQHRQQEFTAKGERLRSMTFAIARQSFWYIVSSVLVGFFYVGRTIRPLRKRFGKHRHLKEEGKDKHSMPGHFLEFHHKSTECLQVWVIEGMPRGLPEAGRFHRLCQRENFWIYNLNALCLVVLRKSWRLPRSSKCLLNTLLYISHIYCFGNI